MGYQYYLELVGYLRVIVDLLDVEWKQGMSFPMGAVITKIKALKEIADRDEKMR